MSDKHLSFVIPVAEEAKKRYDVGYETGYSVGFSKGETDRWNNFWDNFQKAGNRNNYNYAFYGNGWNKQTFKPKYDIKPHQSATQMFYQSEIEDLTACGVNIDFSGCVHFNAVFQESAVKKLGIIDLSNVPNASGSPKILSCFSGCKNLETIKKLILPSQSKNQYSALFYNCIALKNLTIEGVIDSNGFNVSDCTLLTRESLLSIINALATVTTTKTVTLGEENIAKLTDDEIQVALDKGWTLA